MIYSILCAIALVVVVAVFVVAKYKEKKGNLSFKQVLYELVVEAEDFYGSKKGQEKFNYAYSHLVMFFPYAKFIPKAIINKMIIKALDVMEETLKQ